MALKIQKAFFKVSDFISWQKAGNLVLTPEFQRRSVWKPGAKSYLIDTIVRGFPIPIIFLRDKRTSVDDFEPKREIIDGQQRLRTVLSYISPDLVSNYESGRDDFTVTKAHNIDLAGKQFNDLDVDVRSAILDYEFNVHVLSSSVDDREIIQIFRRMNSINYQLNKQELRNANYYGEFKSSVYLLAAEQLNRWRLWKTFTEDNIARMDEVEHTSECVMFIIDGEISGKSAAKINNAFKDYDEVYKHRAEIEHRFRSVMETMDNSFKSELPNFEFFKKTLVYTFFAVISNLLFDDQPLTKHVKGRSLTPEEISKMKLCSERIEKRSAPNRVLEATDRRTTNPKERKTLFQYLLDNVKHAQ